MADENDQEADNSSVQSASFPDLAGTGGGEKGGSPNLDLIRDIQVTLTVELGRTDMLIEEVTGLTPGKVVELDKLAGEPLDVLINGKLLAKGEVVVVDENFGIRITSIVDPRSRVQAIGSSEGEESE